MKWVTRERPKIDRVACPWPIDRFIDREAQFRFVPPADVMRVAHATGAVPYDVEGVELSHVGPLCSFDALLARYVPNEPTPGALAISLGLSRLYADDHEQLRHGFIVYDAPYAWLKEARGEVHSWNPQHGTRAPVAMDLMEWMPRLMK